MLDAACRQVRAWRDAGLQVPRCAVNLSARQFVTDTLVDDVLRSLSRQGLASDALEVEITESVLMADPQRANRTLQALHGLGVHISIDDFGTGYSSLAYLKRFPAQTVKIDRSFVNGLPADRDDAAITQAVIAMAHSLGLQVVAEGVETQAQLDFLRRQGCDEAQGYFIGRPMPAAQLQDRLAPCAEAARQPAMTSAMACAVRSTLPLFSPATQMRPDAHQVDRVLVAQPVDLRRAQAGVAEHAVLGEEVVEVAPRHLGADDFVQRLAHRQDALAHRRQFGLPHRPQVGIGEHVRDDLAAVDRRAGIVAAHGELHLPEHVLGLLGVGADHAERAAAFAVDAHALAEGIGDEEAGARGGQRAHRVGIGLDAVAEALVGQVQVGDQPALDAAAGSARPTARGSGPRRWGCGSRHAAAPRCRPAVSSSVSSISAKRTPPSAPP